MRLWLANIAPGTTDDELKAFLAKYGPDLECLEIGRVDGDGSRPAALIRFANGTTVSVGNLALRLNGMYWKERSLFASTEPN